MTTGVLTWDDIIPGQIWKSCDGRSPDVVIVAVNEKEVWYRCSDSKIRDKDPFSFQCRYYLEV